MHDLCLSLIRQLNGEALVEAEQQDGKNLGFMSHHVEDAYYTHTPNC